MMRNWQLDLCDGQDQTGSQESGLRPAASYSKHGSYASRGIEEMYELTYIRKDGSRFPAVVSVTALRDAQGGIIGYLLIGTDNTARQQVEEERQKLDQRLRDHQFYTRSLFESNIDALMTTDAPGIITDVNKQMEALTGCTRDELIGAPFKNYFTDPERAQTGIRLVLSRKKVTNYELTARDRDGKETVVSYNATTFYDRDRRLQGMFLANMSHEIRTPMNTVTILSYLLGQTSLNEQQLDFLAKIKLASKSLLEVLNNVLDLSKIEAGELIVERAAFSLRSLLKELTDVMAVHADAKAIAFEIDAPDDLPGALEGDATRLNQILTNLLANAIVKTGGATLPCLRRLRLDEQHGKVWMCAPDRDLDPVNTGLDFAGIQGVLEFGAERGDDLIGPDLHGDDAVRRADRRIIAGDPQNRRANAGERWLADQQRFGLTRQQHRRHRKHHADAERRHTVELRQRQRLRARDTRQRDHQTKQGRAVFQQHREGAGVFAVAECLEIALTAHCRAEGLEPDPPRDALKHHRCGQHRVVDQRPFHRMWVQQVGDALVER